MFTGALLGQAGLGVLELGTSGTDPAQIADASQAVTMSDAAVGVPGGTGFESETQDVTMGDSSDPVAESNAEVSQGVTMGDSTVTSVHYVESVEQDITLSDVAAAQSPGEADAASSVSLGASISVTVLVGANLLQLVQFGDSAVIINSTGSTVSQGISMHDAATYVGQQPPNPTLFFEFEVDETPDLFAEG